MTTNDVSARDLQVRADRPGLRSDWLNGKSHDNFAPMGPFLVPRAFVKDHMNLFIRLTVNGEVKQNGNTSQFIFTPEEQIEYASGILSLQSGDIFSCGTCGGVGQGTNTFLKVGDVMETEIEGLGQDAQQVRRRKQLAFMLASQRALFDLPNDVCYLNAASYGPLPLATVAAARQAVERKSRPWEIDSSFAAGQHERARKAAAGLINADPDDVALISSVSYGVATAVEDPCPFRPDRACWCCRTTIPLRCWSG